MPLLPIEAPQGVQFDYAAGAAGIKLHASRGLYAFDAVNGTRYLNEALASMRSIALAAGAEAANSIPVTVTVQAPGSSVTVAAAQRCLAVLVDNTGTIAVSTDVGSVSGGGSAVSAVGNAWLIFDTAADGTCVLNITDAGAATAHLLVRPLNAIGEQAHVALTFAA